MNFFIMFKFEQFRQTTIMYVYREIEMFNEALQ